MLSAKRTSGILGFVIIVVLCNLHLFFGTDPTILVFDTGKVAGGEWWRVITHPFVHVSWYHLLLDCAALLLLWKELRLSSSLQKILVTSGCAAASLLFSMLGSSLIGQYGLCGFSGTAHGLTFLLGIKWIAESQEHRQTDQGLLIFSGLLFIGASAGKSMIEFISGNVIFSNMHIGDLGIPIVESHLGGVIGGLIAFLTLRAMKQKPFDLPRKLSDNQNRGPVIYNKDLNPQISTRIVDIR